MLHTQLVKVVPVSRNHEMVRRCWWGGELGGTTEGVLVDLLSFRQLFRLHARGQDGINLSHSDRWLRQAGILHSPDTAIYFKQVAKFRKSLHFSAYQTYLELLAKKKNLNVGEMKYKMAMCGPPATYKTTEVDNRKAVLVSERRHRKRHKREEVFNREGFFSSCQCQHGYNSQISYSFFPETEDPPTEDWFPEE